MPDFNIETAWTCVSNTHFETWVKGKGGSYRVTFERLHEGAATVYGWRCGCVGFEHRGTCRHVEEVKANDPRCGWNACLEPTLECDIVDTGNEGYEHRCPECGGPVEAFRVAV